MYRSDICGLFFLLLPIITTETMNKWIRRRRNSLGFGVQSPNDFYFVQYVLREKSPYYAYVDMEQAIINLRDDLPHYSPQTNRLLFRLVNYVHPHTIVEVGTGAGLSAYVMTLACMKGHCITISSDERVEIPGNQSQIIVKNGDEMAIFEELLHTLGKIELLHIAHTDNYKTVVETAFPYAGDHTLFIIEGIRDSKEKQEWWESVSARHDSITYDVEDVGLLFFDRSRHKDTYWIKLRD